MNLSQASTLPLCFSAWSKTKCHFTGQTLCKSCCQGESKWELRGDSSVVTVPSWWRRGRWWWPRWPVDGATQLTGPGFLGHQHVVPRCGYQRECWWLPEASAAEEKREHNGQVFQGPLVPSLFLFENWFSHSRGVSTVGTSRGSLAVSQSLWSPILSWS